MDIEHVSELYETWWMRWISNRQLFCVSFSVDCVNPVLNDIQIYFSWRMERQNQMNSMWLEKIIRNASSIAVLKVNSWDFIKICRVSHKHTRLTALLFWIIFWLSIFELNFRSQFFFFFRKGFGSLNIIYRWILLIRCLI